MLYMQWSLQCPFCKHRDTSSTQHCFTGQAPRSRFHTAENSQNQLEYIFKPWTTSQGLTCGSSAVRNDKNLHVWRISISLAMLGLPIAFIWWCLELWAWSNHCIIIIMDSRQNLFCFYSENILNRKASSTFSTRASLVTHTRCYFAYCY